MKKLLILAAAAATFFITAPTTAEAGYRSKVIGHCQHCRGKIYSYYKPTRLSCGRVRYAWVPSYHNTCRNRHFHSNRYSNPRYYRSYRSYHANPYYRGYRYRSGVSGCVNVGGISIRF